MNSHFGNWSPNGLLNLQRKIVGVKTHWIETFFISWKNSCNVDVSNGLAWPIWKLQTQVMAKRRAKVKLTIWLPTIKSQESPWFPCLQVACDILLESSRWKLQLFFKPHLNGRFTYKVMNPKVAGISTLGILGLPLGSLGTKCHLGAGPMARHIIYYKGEGVGFLQVQVMVSLVSLSLSMPHLSTKRAPTMH